MSKFSKKEVLIIVGLILFIILDQLSKFFWTNDNMFFNGIIKFTYVQNTGGAFGIFSANVFTVILLNLIFITMIIRFLIVKKDYISKLVHIGLLLLLAGGSSNLIDRVIRGHVVDFIDITQIVNFPIFNIADIIIVIGWFLLIIGVIKDIREKK